MPEDLAKKFKELEDRINDKHTVVMTSLNDLRTAVLGHYADVNKFAKGLEMKVDASVKGLEGVHARLKRLEDDAGFDNVA